MNGYLLDTHAAIWFLIGDPVLSNISGHIIRDRTKNIHLSVVSAWELAIKISIGKLRFPGNAAGFLKAAEKNDINIIHIKTSHLSAFEVLPFFHRDPFDRLLIATAIDEQFTLITADENIAKYNVPHIW
jgi:PIN domain nuclease of toxin-antitoxin system